MSNLQHHAHVDSHETLPSSPPDSPARVRTEPTVDAVAEDRFWQNAYSTQSYYMGSRTYDHYGPAYRLGIAYRLGPGGHRTWKQCKRDLEPLWGRRKAFSSLSWEQARDAVWSAWNRIDHALAWCY